MKTSSSTVLSVTVTVAEGEHAEYAIPLFALLEKYYPVPVVLDEDGFCPTSIHGRYPTARSAFMLQHWLEFFQKNPELVPQSLQEELKIGLSVREQQLWQVVAIMRPSGRSNGTIVASYKDRGHGHRYAAASKERCKRELQQVPFNCSAEEAEKLSLAIVDVEGGNVTDTTSLLTYVLKHVVTIESLRDLNGKEFKMNYLPAARLVGVSANGKAALQKMCKTHLKMIRVQRGAFNGKLIDERDREVVTPVYLEDLRKASFKDRSGREVETKIESSLLRRMQLTSLQAYYLLESEVQTFVAERQEDKELGQLAKILKHWQLGKVLSVEENLFLKKKGLIDAELKHAQVKANSMFPKGKLKLCEESGLLAAAALSLLMQREGNVSSLHSAQNLLSFFISCLVTWDRASKTEKLPASKQMRPAPPGFQQPFSPWVRAVQKQSWVESEIADSKLCKRTIAASYRVNATKKTASPFSIFERKYVSTVSKETDFSVTLWSSLKTLFPSWKNELCKKLHSQLAVHMKDWRSQYLLHSFYFKTDWLLADVFCPSNRSGHLYQGGNFMSQAELQEKLNEDEWALNNQARLDGMQPWTTVRFYGSSERRKKFLAAKLEIQCVYLVCLYEHDEGQKAGSTFKNPHVREQFAKCLRRVFTSDTPLHLLKCWNLLVENKALKSDLLLNFQKDLRVLLDDLFSLNAGAFRKHLEKSSESERNRFKEFLSELELALGRSEIFAEVKALLDELQVNEADFETAKKEELRSRLLEISVTNASSLIEKFKDYEKCLVKNFPEVMELAGKSVLRKHGLFAVERAAGGAGAGAGAAPPGVDYGAALPKSADCEVSLNPDIYAGDRVLCCISLFDSMKLKLGFLTFESYTEPSSLSLSSRMVKLLFADLYDPGDADSGALYDSLTANARAKVLTALFEAGIPLFQKQNLSKTVELLAALCSNLPSPEVVIEPEQGQSRKVLRKLEAEAVKSAALQERLHCLIHYGEIEKILEGQTAKSCSPELRDLLYRWIEVDWHVVDCLDFDWLRGSWPKCVLITRDKAKARSFAVDILLLREIPVKDLEGTPWNCLRQVLAFAVAPDRTPNAELGKLINLVLNEVLAITESYQLAGRSIPAYEITKISLFRSFLMQAVPKLFIGLNERLLIEESKSAPNFLRAELNTLLNIYQAASGVSSKLFCLVSPESDELKAFYDLSVRLSDLVAIYANYLWLKACVEKRESRRITPALETARRALSRSYGEITGDLIKQFAEKKMRCEYFDRVLAQMKSLVKSTLRVLHKRPDFFGSRLLSEKSELLAIAGRDEYQCFFWFLKQPFAVYSQNWTQGFFKLSALPEDELPATVKDAERVFNSIFTS